MLSALQQLGFKNKQGIIERLPLAYDGYDPEKVAIDLYNEGYTIYIWNFSMSTGYWGEPYEWKPAKHKSKKEIRRPYSQLSDDEKDTFWSMIRDECSAREISDEMDVDIAMVWSYKQQYRNGKRSGVVKRKNNH